MGEHHRCLPASPRPEPSDVRAVQADTYQLAHVTGWEMVLINSQGFRWNTVRSKDGSNQLLNDGSCLDSICFVLVQTRL